MRKFFLSFGVGWRGVGLNVVGRVLRDRGIGNCGRESLSVGVWEDLSDLSDWSDVSDLSDGSEGREPVVLAAESGCFGGIWGNFFVVLDFFCIFVAWYFVFIPYFVLKLN